MHEASALAVRKLVHFATGILILILTWLLEKDTLLYLILAGTFFAFITFPFRRFYLLHKTTHNSLGTLFYPLGILSAYLLLYNLPVYYFQTALMVLVLSDTTANLLGKIKNSNVWFRAGEDDKSLHGIAGFVAASLLIVYMFLPVSLLVNAFYVFCFLMIAVAMEVLSWRGSDNLSIPLGLALFFFLSEHYPLDYVFLSGVLLLMSVGCFLLYHFKILTRYGSLAAWLLGIYLLSVGGYVWTLPVVAFFISSVVFTKIRGAILGRTHNKGAGRNAWQVVANIIWALLSSLFYLLTGSEVFIILFIVFVAAVTADTWASELGPLFSRRSYSLADMRWKKAGTTGGVSFAGSIAALAASLFIASLSWVVFFEQWDTTRVGLITLSAFLACFSDTLLGAFVEGRLVQMRFFSKRQGVEDITPNDIVNMGGSLTAGLFYWLF